MKAIRELCGIDVPDGIGFDPETVGGEEIRVPNEYAGVRVRLEANLARARIPVQVDVGFGDAVIPTPTWEQYPALLDHPPPRILIYPREAVVAEKLEAVVSLGITSTRMKDLFDLHRLSAKFPFDGTSLSHAIRATFQRRGTAIPDAEPLILTREFLTAIERQTQWRAFLRRSRLEGPHHPGVMVDDLRAFLLPVIEATAAGHALEGSWAPGGPWGPEDGQRRP